MAKIKLFLYYFNDALSVNVAWIYVNNHEEKQLKIFVIYIIVINTTYF